VGFVVVKVALGQVFLRVFRFSPVNFIQAEKSSFKQKKELIFITGLHISFPGCGASVTSAMRPFNKKNEHQLASPVESNLGKRLKTSKRKQVSSRWFNLCTL
jgi:hypothetical protein